MAVPQPCSSLRLLGLMRRRTEKFTRAGVSTEDLPSG